MRAHIITGGVVANTIEAESLDAAAALFPDATVIEAATGGPGWLWDGATLSEPPPPPAPVPASVTPLQARRALLAIDALDDVEAALAQAPRGVQLAWEYAIEVRRDDATLAAVAAGLGWSDAQLDDLFRAAAAL